MSNSISTGYAVVQKAASWTGDFNMFMKCINEFHMLNLDDDQIAEIGMVSHRNGIAPYVLNALDI